MTQIPCAIRAPHVIPALLAVHAFSGKLSVKLMRATTADGTKPNCAAVSLPNVNWSAPFGARRRLALRVA